MLMMIFLIATLDALICTGKVGAQRAVRQVQGLKEASEAPSAGRKLGRRAWLTGSLRAEPGGGASRRIGSTGLPRLSRGRSTQIRFGTLGLGRSDLVRFAAIKSF